MTYHRMVSKFDTELANLCHVILEGSYTWVSIAPLGLLLLRTLG